MILRLETVDRIASPAGGIRASDGAEVSAGMELLARGEAVLSRVNVAIHLRWLARKSGARCKARSPWLR